MNLLLMKWPILRFLPSKPWRLRAWRSWFSYVHWRLETYGVYYPDGRFHPRAFFHLLRQGPAYRAWLKSFPTHR